MSDANTQENSKNLSQDEIDREQFIAGAELGRELINAAMLNPGKVDQNKIMRQIQSLMTPSRFKDLSPIDLRKMVFDEYVETASREMMKNLNENTYQVEIPMQHGSVGEDLAKHWEKKGYNVTTQKEHDRIKAIRLVW
jgi:hypothetical protein